MSYNPPLDVPKELVNWMREHASSSAFLADMLRMIDRKGGLTQGQLDMVRARQEGEACAKIAEGWSSVSEGAHAIANGIAADIRARR